MNKQIPKLLIFAVLCLSILLPRTSSAQDIIKISHGPYLPEATENSATIMWFTNKKSVSWIEYGNGSNRESFPTYGSVVETAEESEHGLVDAYTLKHKVRLTGLKPGQKVRYRIFNKEIVKFMPYEVTYGDCTVSEIYEFKTFDTGAENFSFVITNDGHDDSKKLGGIFKQLPLQKVDIMFFNGDMLSYIENEDDIFDGFLDICVESFAPEIPMVYIRGNHETRGLFGRKLFQYFPHSSGRFYYSFNHGQVHFIIMDTGEDKPDAHPVYAGLVDFDSYRNEQAEWLKEDIQSNAFKSAKYRIALFHMPSDKNSARHGSRYIGEKWGPVLNDAGIDVIFNGHTHRFSHIDPEPGNRNYPVIILGQRMTAQVNVTPANLSIVVETETGEQVKTIILPVKQR